MLASGLSLDRGCEIFVRLMVRMAVAFALMSLATLTHGQVPPNAKGKTEKATVAAPQSPPVTIGGRCWSAWSM